MNNVVNLNQQRADTCFWDRDSSVSFPVEERRLFAASGPRDDLEVCMVDDFKGIVRTDGTPRSIGVVGTDYKLLHHDEFFDAIEGQIKSTLRVTDLEGSIVNTKVAFDGAFIERQYLMPAMAGTVDTIGVQSKVGFRIVAFNSLDGSSSAGLLCGAIDYYCSNGMILGSFIGKKLRRHTRGLETELFRETIEQSASEYYLCVNRFRAWAIMEVDEDRVKTFLESAFSERRAGRVFEQVQDEFGRRGRTLWAVYSALTYYASHDSERFPIRQTSRDHAAKTFHDRELEVQVMTSQPVFEQLAA